MKIYKDKVHVKTISKKFESLVKDEKGKLLDPSIVLDCFYQEKKRPTDYEKLNLEIELLKLTLSDSIMDIIKGLPFKGIERAHYRNGITDHLGKFKGGEINHLAIFGNIRITCHQRLYLLQNVHKEVYRNV